MSESIWKKEISFRRKPKPTPPPKPAKPEPQAKAAASKQSIWKKEITLGRKKAKDEQAAPAPPPMTIAPEPERRPEPEPEPEPQREPEQLPHAAGDYEWRTEAAAPAAHPLAAEPGPTPMPHNVFQLAPSVTAVPPVPEPEQHGEFEREPEAEATAPETEPEPEPEPPKQRKQSFLKRDLGRKKDRPDTDAPTEELRPKREKAPKAPRPPRVANRGKQLVGLKVGASQVAAARIVNNGAAELVQVARAELPPGLVVGGELRDPDALGDFLRGFFKEQRLPTKGVRLGLSNNRIGVRSFEIAGIEEPKQLANAIRFRAQESLPIPIEEAVLDYRVLSEGRNDEGEPTRRILLVVAYRDLVDRYVAACRRAGLTLSGIDLEAFALLRSLAPPRGDEDESDAAVVAVSVGHERSTLAVSDGRVCEFTRVVEWGGSAINVAIARALDVSPQEAEPVKRALSLHAPATIEGLTAEQLQAVDDAVRRQVHTFARELVSSLQFYQGQPGSLGIGEIVVTGGTAHLPGLAAELQRLIGVSVRIGDPLARVRVGKRIGEPEQVGSLAVAIGLGIED